MTNYPRERIRRDISAHENTCSSIMVNHRVAPLTVSGCGERFQIGFPIESPSIRFFFAQVSSGLLQTAQTWANAGVCGGLCACAVGGTFD